MAESTERQFRSETTPVISTAQSHGVPYETRTMGPETALAFTRLIQITIQAQPNASRAATRYQRGLTFRPGRPPDIPRRRPCP